MILVVFAMALVAADFCATLFTIFYKRFLYERAYRTRFDRDYTPHCAVVIPCKGLLKNFEENLRTFLTLEYPSYQVIYTVESENDPAVPVIRTVVQSDPRATLVVAGLSTKCAQKNHNLLAAVNTAPKADVYVFADADIGPGGNWLRELILPLSSERVAVTTGFRWLYVPKPTLGEMVHNQINIFIYMLLANASFLAKVGLWGGSMAIRRAEFERMKVAEVWGRTVVDDMSLSGLVMKSGKRSVVVPSAVTCTDDLIETVSGSVRWFERQIMFLKAHHRLIWFYMGVPLCLFALLLMVWLPIAALLSISPERTFFAVGGAAPFIFILGEMVVALLYPFMGQVPQLGRFALWLPFMRSALLTSYFRTHFTNVVTWAGIRYHMSTDGRVTRVERPLP